MNKSLTKFLQYIVLFIWITMLPPLTGTITAKATGLITTSTEIILTFLGSWILIILFSLAIIYSEIKTDSKND